MPSTTTRYWLSKLGLKTAYKQKNLGKDYDELTSSNCYSCKITKPISEFHKVLKGSHYKPRPYCKTCDNALVRKNRAKRTVDAKALAVEYKGGKCIVCSYSACHKALDFHHVNGDEKEVGISKLINRAVVQGASHLKRLKTELDKCVLLCCRCHREFHAGFITLPSTEGDSSNKEP